MSLIKALSRDFNDNVIKHHLKVNFFDWKNAQSILQRLVDEFGWQTASEIKRNIDALHNADLGNVLSGGIDVNNLISYIRNPSGYTPRVRTVKNDSFAPTVNGIEIGYDDSMYSLKEHAVPTGELGEIMKRIFTKSLQMGKNIDT